MLVRILLDTCTIRHHLYANGNRLDFGAIRSSKEQLRFSLPSGAVVELQEQLTEGRVTWADWTREIPLIDSILDQRWPMLPNGRQLAAIAGTQPDISIDLEAERRHLRAVWQLQCHSKCTEDLQRGDRYEGADGQKYGVKLEIPKLQKVANEQRQSWQDYIRHIKTRPEFSGKVQVTEAEILSLMKLDLCNTPGDPPNLGDKLDAVSRMTARFVAQALNPHDPYNPDSEKRRGDAFDIDLLFYIPLPSVICTADLKFVNRLRGTGAPHARQVVSIEELNQCIRDGTVGALVSDFRTPDEQIFQWE